MSYLVMATAVATLAACGGGEADNNSSGNNGGTNNGEGALTATEFERQWAQLLAQARCKAVFDCPEKQQWGSVLRISRFGDVDTCIDEFPRESRSFFEPADAIEDGLAEFNSESAQACLDELEMLLDGESCLAVARLENMPLACANAGRGLQSVGEPCVGDSHCASGSCDTAADVGDVCWDGACAEAPEPSIQGEGEPCDVGGPRLCDPSANLFCELNADGTATECVTPGSRAEDDPCTSTATCGDGLFCRNLNGDTRCASTSVAAEGGNCTIGGACEPGLGCEDVPEDGGFSSGECIRLKSEGDECYADTACAYDLYCNGGDVGSQTPGTCEPRLGPDSPCDLGRHCQLGLTCDFDDDICVDDDLNTCEIPSE